MAMLKQPSPLGANQLVVDISQIYAGLAAAIARLFAAKRISAARLDTAAAARSAQLFAQALEENSGLEFDWLWYAANMTSSAHRRYCLQRALRINPGSEMARRALAKLALQENR
jgi:hypothetical protein